MDFGQTPPNFRDLVRSVWSRDVTDFTQPVKAPCRIQTQYLCELVMNKLLKVQLTAGLG